VPVLKDGVRQADEDNPRGYLEYDPVKMLRQDSKWLPEARGKALKIVAPLLTALPAGLPCRVILIERDLNEILNSQAQMLVRRGENLPDTLERRDRLQDAYARTLRQAKTFLRNRPSTRLLALERGEVLRRRRASANSWAAVSILRRWRRRWTRRCTGSVCEFQGQSRLSCSEALAPKKRGFQLPLRATRLPRRPIATASPR
jgi:hypothetical protein